MQTTTTHQTPSTQHPTSSSHHTPRFLHTPRSHHTSTPRHTSSSRRRHLHYTHHQRHSPSNEQRVATFPARRVETRRGAARFPPKHPHGPLLWLTIGLLFHNAHVSHGAVKRHLPPLPGSKARKGRGEGQRVRAIGGEIERARKRAGKKRSERAQGVANEKEGEARCWKDVLRVARAKKRS